MNIKDNIKAFDYSSEQKEIAELYKKFNDYYAIDKLKELEDGELVDRLFASKDKGKEIGIKGLFTWLEFHADKLGNIRGGSQTGIKDKESEYIWYGNGKKVLLYEEAKDKAKKVLQVLKETCDLINKKANELKTVKDYEDLADKISKVFEKAGDAGHLYWSVNNTPHISLMKYYHFSFPELFTPYYSNDRLKKILEVLGETEEISENGLVNNGRICIWAKANKSTPLKVAKYFYHNPHLIIDDITNCFICNKFDSSLEEGKTITCTLRRGGKWTPGSYVLFIDENNKAAGYGTIIALVNDKGVKVRVEICNKPDENNLSDEKKKSFADQFKKRNGSKVDTHIAKEIIAWLSGDGKKKEDISMNVNYPNNMILYGPPGTGKTYNTVNYAVGIIEGKDFENIKKEPYADVKSRYDKYVASGQIAFTTFHQSYGYEEFIEGIKPVMDSSVSDVSELQYIVKPGIFKSFCEQAGMPVIREGEVQTFGLNDYPKIWKTSLYSTGDNEIRKDCMENGYIRIGWDSYGQEITDETDFSKYGGKNVLNAFINRMSIGDVVLSCYSASTIDAIGVVTGDYEWHDEFDNLKRVRKVKWIVKGINHNILGINNGASMTLATIYQMNIKLSDVLNIIDLYSESSEQKKYSSNDKKYVFIIDEINRGNISKIFGELITLIEPAKRIGRKEAVKVNLPYSNESFGVPDNVYLIGTMNTADRSIALMDTALRRRFDFVEMKPDADLLVDFEYEGVNIVKLLKTLNDRIEVLYDREHTLGHAYFMRPDGERTLKDLAGIFRSKLIPLLQEYFFDDYEKIQLVLGDNQKSDDDLKFISKSGKRVEELFGEVLDSIDISDSYTINVNESDPRAYTGIYE